MGWAAEPYIRTSLSAIHAMGNSGARRHWPVAFEATALYYRSYENMLYVEDGAGGIYVRTPNDARVAAGDRLSLLGGQPGAARRRLLPGMVRLGDPGVGDLEGQLEALEELAAVDRGRGEDQTRRGWQAITDGETIG